MAARRIVHLDDSGPPRLFAVFSSRTQQLHGLNGERGGGAMGDGAWQGAPI